MSLPCGEHANRNARCPAKDHAQQAAERSLKAFLAWHDVPFRKTHNIEELGRPCVGLDATLGAIIDRAVPLTES